MGLPTIDIKFQSLAASAISRSERGIVALVLKDDTGSFDTKVYKSTVEIQSADWTAANLDLIKKALLGYPNMVIVERIDTEDADYTEAFVRLGAKKWDYLAIPYTGVAADIVSWIKSQRSNQKTYKAVVANNAADDEGIINFTTDDIETEDEIYSAVQYTVRIAGILAGLSLARSSTYYELPEIKSIAESSDPDADIDSGKLILINDGEKIKIGRGVNSLTTITSGKSSDWKKIKIIEGMDMISSDIRKTFNDEYVGKVVNSYDNQVLFITAINAYLSTMEGTVLDGENDNSVSIDINAQRAAWLADSVDVSELSDLEIKIKTYKSKVFLTGNMKLLDAMEDLSFNIYV